MCLLIIIKKILKLKTTTLLFLLFIGIVTSEAQNFQWAKSMGGSGGESGYSIALDDSGNIVTTGSFRETADFDPGIGTSNLTSLGKEDVFISKIDKSGNFLWAKCISGTSSEVGTSVDVDSYGDVYVTGYFRGTVDFEPGIGTYNLSSSLSNGIFILKLDSDGNFIWAKNINGGTGKSITVDDSGNVYITGMFQGEGVDFDPGEGIYNIPVETFFSVNIFILKLDTSGNFLWAKSIKGSLGGDYQSRFITSDDFGNVYITGNFVGSVDFDPGTGTNNLTSEIIQDVFVLKLDTSGNFQWVKRMGGVDYDGGQSIAVDNSGNVYTAGYFRGTADFNPGEGINSLTAKGIGDIFISKLDKEGNFKWAKNIGGDGVDEVFSIAVDGSGNLYATGSFQGTVDFDPSESTNNLLSAGSYDAFILKLDTLGNFRWAKNMGGTDVTVGCSVALENNNIYITGLYWETSDFDPGEGTNSLTTKGQGDIFISKLGEENLDILENNFGNNLKFYPNPNNGILNIDLDKSYNEVDVIIRNQIGQVISKKSFSDSTGFQINLPREIGLYFIELNTNYKREIIKVVKQ